MPIHATALISQGAEIDPTADIGPYCMIGPHAKIGPHVKLRSHVVVENHTTLEANVVAHAFAVLGGMPQDLKYKGEPSRLHVGERTIIRESATLNTGTEGGHMETRVGSDCLIMAYAHVAHDCRLGNGVILANGVALAGHVDIEDQVIVGGLAAIHQFVVVGQRAFIGGGAMVAQDVPPYCIAVGDRAALVGLNLVGLKRAGWSRDRLRDLRQAFEQLFGSHDATRQQALSTLEQSASEDVRAVCQFVRSSKRGICPAKMERQELD